MIDSVVDLLSSLNIYANGDRMIKFLNSLNLPVCSNMVYVWVHDINPNSSYEGPLRFMYHEDHEHIIIKEVK